MKNHTMPFTHEPFSVQKVYNGLQSVLSQQDFAFLRALDKMENQDGSFDPFSVLRNMEEEHQDLCNTQYGTISPKHLFRDPYETFSELPRNMTEAGPTFDEGLEVQFFETPIFAHADEAAQREPVQVAATVDARANGSVKRRRESTRQMFVEVERKDMSAIASLLQRMRARNNFQIGGFAAEDELFRYEFNDYEIMSPTQTAKNRFQYQPAVRRIPKCHFTTNHIDYTPTLDGFSHTLVRNTKHTTSKKAKLKKHSEGLCPYCSEVVFAEFKNSTYLHHLNKQHGIFSNGESVPLPANYGLYRREVDNVLMECVECSDCNKIVPLNLNSVDKKKLLGYLRHYSDEHKRGSKLDHKLKNSVLSKHSRSI